MAPGTPCSPRTSAHTCLSAPSHLLSPGALQAKPALWPKHPLGNKIPALNKLGHAAECLLPSLTSSEERVLDSNGPDRSSWTVSSVLTPVCRWT